MITVPGKQELSARRQELSARTYISNMQDLFVEYLDQLESKNSRLYAGNYQLKSRSYRQKCSNDQLESRNRNSNLEEGTVT